MQTDPPGDVAPPPARAPWTRRLAPTHWLVADAVAGAVGAAVTAARVVAAAREFDPHGRGNPPPDGPAALAVALLAVAALGAAVAVRRRRPAGACVLAALAWTGLSVGCRQPAMGLVAGFWAVVAGMLVAYTAAAHGRRAARTALGAAVFGWAVTLAAPGEVRGNVLLAVVGQAAAWAVGDAVRRHRAHLAGAAAYRAALDRAARDGERLRLAREVHDIVAHGLGVVSVQAGFGRYALARRPEEADAALAAIRVVSGEALRETRALLAVLREDAAAVPAVPPPAPGLAPADLERLAARTAAAGVAVAVTVRGPVRALPPGAGLAGYRVVREALANVIRHSGAARATVEVEYREAEVWLEITDGGGGDPGQSGGGSGGTGLAGMRERVAPYGGWCVAGPLPGGGFRVTAVLPVELEGVGGA
ncbi:sensor histidine kinase [Kitasatospora sp. NPDC059327]|uniref:sensor histidine kinase n=1 Tax=Kitasatospora sp. NPDC059327 TaxID=3346803 RepID=UPI0036D111FD